MTRKRRMVILAEGNFSPLRSKTANGAIVYLRDEVFGVIDSTMAGKTAQEVLGYGGDIPVFKTIEESLRLKPNTLLIGIAPAGGMLPKSWIPILRTAIKNRLEIVSGMHTFISDEESMKAAEAIERETGLPAIDTLRFGGRKLADALINYFSNID